MTDTEYNSGQLETSCGFYMIKYDPVYWNWPRKEKKITGVTFTDLTAVLLYGQPYDFIR